MARTPGRFVRPREWARNTGRDTCEKPGANADFSFVGENSTRLHELSLSPRNGWNTKEALNEVGRNEGALLEIPGARSLFHDAPFIEQLRRVLMTDCS